MTFNRRAVGWATHGLAALALVGCSAPATGPIDAARTSDTPTTDLSGDDATAREVLTGTIGPAGGELRGAGVVLRVPEGALDRTVTLRAEDTGLSPPPPYDGYSNVWRFTPEGLTFARPVTVSLRFRRGPDPAVAWSRAGAEGYEWRSSEVAGDVISASVDHFSTGFVAARTPVDAAVPDAAADDRAALPDVPDMTDAPDVLDVPARPDASSSDAAPSVDASTDADVTTDVPAREDVPIDSPPPTFDAPIVDVGATPDAGVAEDVIACRSGDVGPDGGGDPDLFPGAEIIPDAPALTVDFDRVRTGLNAGLTCLSDTTESRDAVLHFRLTESRDVTFSVTAEMSTQYTYVQLQRSCVPGAPTLGACRVGRAQTNFRRALPAGDYYLVLGAFGPRQRHAVQVRTAPPTTPPPGDTCGNPMEVTPNGPPSALPPTNLGLDADVGLACATPADHYENTDGVWHFRLDTTSNLTVTTTAGPSQVWWRLQRWGCAVDSTAVGFCTATGATSIRTFAGQTPGDYYLIGEWRSGYTGSVAVSVATSPVTGRQRGDLCSDPLVVTPDGPPVSIRRDQLAAGDDHGLRGNYTESNASTRRDADFVYTLSEPRDVVVTVEDTEGTGSTYFEVHRRCGEWPPDLGLSRLDTRDSTRELVIPRQAAGTWFIAASLANGSVVATARVRTFPAGTFNTYSLSQPTSVVWTPACGVPGSTVLIAPASGSTAQMPLPFALRYWGVDIPAGFSVNVSRYGHLNLDGIVTSGGGTLPSPTAPNGIVAPAPRSDWRVRAPGLCTVVLGTAPNRRWVIQWNSSTAPLVGTGIPADYEVIVSEGTNTLDFVYGVSAGVGAAGRPGIEDLSGTNAVTWDYGIDEGTRIRFTPTR